MASYLGLQKKFLPNLKQYEATTGRPISDRALQSYLYAALQTEADRKDAAYARERGFGFQQQGLDIQKQAIKDQAAANKISGITQLAGLPIQGALGYGVLKQAGLLGAKPAMGTAQGLLGGAGSTAVGAGAQTGLATAGELLTGGAASTSAGAIAAAPTGAGFLGTIAPYAGPAGAGFLGAKLLGGPLDKILPGGGKTGQVIGGTAGGALAGFAAGAAIGSGAGPIGAVIGGIIGGISSLF